MANTFPDGLQLKAFPALRVNLEKSSPARIR